VRARLRIPASHLLVGSACFGLAVSLAARSTEPAVPLAAACLATFALLLGSRSRALVLAAALAAAGWWWGSVRLDALDASSLARQVGRSALARVEVTGAVRRGAFALQAPVRVLRFGDLEPRETARLELPLGRAPPRGAILELVASVRRPRPAEGDRAFDEEEYLRRQGAHAILRAGWFREVGRRGGLAGFADRLHRALARSLAPGQTGERRAVVAGVVLGEDEGLADDLRDDFRASGLYHLLAVSGQNVGYVVLGALLAAWVLGLPRWIGHVGALLGVAGYVLAVGWQPSVVRAGVAGALASLAWLVARPTDRWYFLLLGAAVLAAVNPYSLLEPGFQLSFAAVAAIFLVVPRLERRLDGYPVPSRIVGVLAVSVACGVVTAPILWLHFGAVPIFSVVSNALASPVVAPLLGMGLAAAALHPLIPSAATALAWLNGWLAAYLAWCARFVGGLPHAQTTSIRAVAALALVAAFILIAVRLRPPRVARLLTLALILALVLGGWRLARLTHDADFPPPQGFRITFLDVGQGDAVLLQVREGAVLVDEGPPEAHVSHQLDDLGVDTLAVLVLTHPQRDHVGGAADVLREERVGLVLDPRLPFPSSYEDAALVEARHEGVPVVTARAGRTYRLGHLRLSVLWPDAHGSFGEDPNDHAMVLLASFGRVDALLTADAESNVTLPLRPPAVEVLKVAHHGSADSGLPALLEQVRPRVAVVSVGAGNDYGHPAPSTLSALRGVSGLDVYRTDEDGRVVIETDGERLSVRSER
jgi:competence protein ComEC